MIIINFTSGLGNQLFQFFFGETLDLEFKDQEIKYLNSLLPPDQIKVWDIFDLKVKKINRHEIKMFNFLIRKNKYLFINFIKIMIKLNLNKNTFLFSDNNYNHYSNILFDKSKTYLFYGYWQNKKFFEKNFENIRKKLSFKKKLSLKLIDKSLYNFDQIIGIHVRGGDYLKAKNKKIFYSIDIDYYKKSIHYFKSLFKNPIFIFFTDDIEYLKTLFNNIDFEHRFIFDLNDDRNDDFQYLSQCDHFIIPNSSFSLWASYFSTNKNKIIVKPENWFREDYTPNFETSNFF